MRLQEISRVPLSITSSDLHFLFGERLRSFSGSERHRSTHSEVWYFRVLQFVVDVQCCRWVLLNWRAYVFKTRVMSFPAAAMIVKARSTNDFKSSRSNQCLCTQISQVYNDEIVIHRTIWSLFLNKITVGKIIQLLTLFLVYVFVFFFPLAGFAVEEVDQNSQKQEEYNCEKWGKIRHEALHCCLLKTIMNECSDLCHERVGWGVRD